MSKLDKKQLTGIAALLVHAAKIDEHYSDKEKNIILLFIKSFAGKGEIVEQILKEAENLENNSNQLLDFTNIIKKSSQDFKARVIKELWKIIISNDISDEYESNLMRRICGLIYFSDKLSGEIKMSITLERKKI
ncbi:MAG: Tellurite resistance protein TerB [Pelagibacterales bacterium MED-G40]|nr:MAG: Tellurite resistance protein TerB [Pelagibacterales bacterium MED-G40]|tara:strand:+ start:4567 stop:4968 length:402 start_codon:yes stop_codon:yes gene_type:complete